MQTTTLHVLHIFLTIIGEDTFFFTNLNIKYSSITDIML